MLKTIELNNPNINIRYYACKEFDQNFDPNFCIIENVCAFVGFSNLTYEELFHNLEVIELNCENPIYEDYKIEFWFEWEYAKPLTK